MSGTEDETKLLPAAIPGFPRGKHEIILADPPWNYKDKANAGKRGASHKYMTQSDNWIKNLPVEKIAADDAVLFLWVTMPFLPVGLEVMESWGFKFKTNAFTWVKTTKDGKGVKWRRQAQQASSEQTQIKTLAWPISERLVRTYSIWTRDTP